MKHRRKAFACGSISEGGLVEHWADLKLGPVTCTLEFMSGPELQGRVGTDGWGIHIVLKAGFQPYALLGIRVPGRYLSVLSEPARFLHFRNMGCKK